MSEPTIHQVSRVVRLAAYSRFSDPVTGFNPLISWANGQYGLTPPIPPVDFSSKSRNVVFGPVSALSIIETTTSKFPMIAMYTHGIVNKNFIKFREFSGQVILGVDIWHSWTKSQVLHDFETYADTFEEVTLELINGFGPSGNGDVTQNWGSNVVYNGGVSCSRTEILPQANNWFQGYQFRFTFHMDTSDDAAI
jgi:hypothetical protein